MERHLEALILGGTAWNRMLLLDAFPQPVPQTLFAARTHEALGSSGAGKALNLRHLGADVTLWSLLGEDPAGGSVRRTLDA